MELTMPRLLLREFRQDDHAATHIFGADPEVTRYMDWGPNTPEDTAAFLDEVAASAAEEPRTRFGLAVVDPVDQTLFGSIELRVTSTLHGRGELGYVLARSRWGNGYATEAAAALLAFGFESLALHRISATCDVENVGSSRVLAKIGMEPEGRLREYVDVRGQRRDRLLFAALRSTGRSTVVGVLGVG
jgi:ribosomal-protein-alanine N-acetyltransferase